MDLRFSFQPYRRAFVHPLRTARGAWKMREGFILRAESAEGVFRHGEVAPIPEFGTESLGAAADYLRRLSRQPELAVDAEALAELPCCAFAVSCVIASDPLNPLPPRVHPVAALLPAGAAALEVAAGKYAGGHRSFKWKIGVGRVDEEEAVFRKLLARLPDPAVTFRLDGNCGFSVAQLENWLRFLQPYRSRLEYLEQPLPVGRESTMAAMSETFGVPVALDESLHGAGGGRWLEAGAWSGPLVVKPLLSGNREELIARLRPIAKKVVLSSAFETLVGLENALQVADALPEMDRALGFDTLNAFETTSGPASAVPRLSLDALPSPASLLDPLWKPRPHSI